MKQAQTEAANRNPDTYRTSVSSRCMAILETQPEHPSKIELPIVRVGGMPIHGLTETQCVDHIFHQLRAGYGGWVVTVNLDHLRIFSHAPWYAALCAQASLAVADGMPLVWASHLQGTPLPERVTGSNLIWSLTAAASTHEKSIFLLGGSTGTAEAAAAELQRHYPALKIAGTFCPSTGFEKNPAEIAHLTHAVISSAPDLVYVGLGKPKQDLLINELRSTLAKTWFIGVGTSFSFVSGTMPRAPLWMQRFGLEWLHRLAQNPRQLATRYLIHGLPFAVRLLVEAAIRRVCSAAHKI
jgi:N-acetylglucosaminyldiphosphoundecaprenol N-acetyl-beta-D-mannosaminyltransferase